MNSTMNKESNGVQKLLKLSDKSILIKKKELDEQVFKLKSECDNSIRRKLYLYVEEKKVTEEFKKCEYRLNQKQSLWKEKSLMHIQITKDIEALKKKVDDVDSKQHLEKYFRNILSAKKKYEELQSIYDVTTLKQEISKLDTEMSMFESDIDEIFEQYQTLCKEYENEDEEVCNLDKLELVVKSNLKAK